MHNTKLQLSAKNFLGSEAACLHLSSSYILLSLPNTELWGLQSSLLKAFPTERFPHLQYDLALSHGLVSVRGKALAVRVAAQGRSLAQNAGTPTHMPLPRAKEMINRGRELLPRAKLTRYPYLHIAETGGFKFDVTELRDDEPLPGSVRIISYLPAIKAINRNAQEYVFSAAEPASKQAYDHKEDVPSRLSRPRARRGHTRTPITKDDIPALAAASSKTSLLFEVRMPGS